MKSVNMKDRFSLSDMYDGQKIRKLRERTTFYDDGNEDLAFRAQGMSRAALAKEIGVTPLTIYRVEACQHCSFYLLWRIAWYFHVDWRTLLTEPIVPKPKKKRRTA